VIRETVILVSPRHLPGQQYRAPLVRDVTSEIPIEQTGQRCRFSSITLPPSNVAARWRGGSKGSIARRTGGGKRVRVLIVVIVDRTIGRLMVVKVRNRVRERNLVALRGGLAQPVRRACQREPQTRRQCPAIRKHLQHPESYLPPGWPKRLGSQGSDVLAEVSSQRDPSPSSRFEPSASLYKAQSYSQIAANAHGVEPVVRSCFLSTPSRESQSSSPATSAASSTEETSARHRVSLAVLIGSIRIFEETQEIVEC